jgi:hypothetical protein
VTYRRTPAGAYCRARNAAVEHEDGPTGRLAVAVLLRGSNNAKTDWFYNRNGSLAILR